MKNYQLNSIQGNKKGQNLIQIIYTSESAKSNLPQGTSTYLCYLKNKEQKSCMRKTKEKHISKQDMKISPD